MKWRKSSFKEIIENEEGNCWFSQQFEPFFISLDITQIIHKKVFFTYDYDWESDYRCRDQWETEIEDIVLVLEVQLVVLAIVIAIPATETEEGEEAEVTTSIAASLVDDAVPAPRIWSFVCFSSFLTL